VLDGLKCGAVYLAIALGVCACSETYRGPDPIITPQGAASIDPASGGLVRLFFNSATMSYDAPADSNLAKQMLSDGFALIYANCNEYFRSAAHTQQTLIFGRDLLGTFGTLGTGIVALARAPKDATAIAALITSTGYAIMDDIAKDFLFSADNVEAVRDLTLRTMQADQATVLTNNTFYSYQTAVLYLQANQNYCSLRKIAELVKEATKNAPLQQAPAAPRVNLGRSILPETYAPSAVPAIPPPPPPVPPPAAPPPSAPQGIATFQHIPIRVTPLQQPPTQ
jgi:hypothetical protein